MPMEDDQSGAFTAKEKGKERMLAEALPSPKLLHAFSNRPREALEDLKFEYRLMVKERLASPDAIRQAFQTPMPNWLQIGRERRHSGEAAEFVRSEVGGADTPIPTATNYEFRGNNETSLAPNEDNYGDEPSVSDMLLGSVGDADTSFGSSQVPGHRPAFVVHNSQTAEFNGRQSDTSMSPTIPPTALEEPNTADQGISPTSYFSVHRASLQDRDWALTTRAHFRGMLNSSYLLPTLNTEMASSAIADPEEALLPSLPWGPSSSMEGLLTHMSEKEDEIGSGGLEDSGYGSFDSLLPVLLSGLPPLPACSPATLASEVATSNNCKEPQTFWANLVEQDLPQTSCRDLGGGNEPRQSSQPWNPSALAALKPTPNDTDSDSDDSLEISEAQWAVLEKQLESCIGMVVDNRIVEPRLKDKALHHLLETGRSSWKWADQFRDYIELLCLLREEAWKYSLIRVYFTRQHYDELKRNPEDDAPQPVETCGSSLARPSVWKPRGAASLRNMVERRLLQFFIEDPEGAPISTSQIRRLWAMANQLFILDRHHRMKFEKAAFPKKRTCSKREGDADGTKCFRSGGYNSTLSEVISVDQEWPTGWEALDAKPERYKIAGTKKRDPMKVLLERLAFEASAEDGWDLGRDSGRRQRKSSVKVKVWEW